MISNRVELGHDNRKKSLPNEWERGDEELRKLHGWEKKAKPPP